MTEEHEYPVSDDPEETLEEFSEVQDEVEDELVLHSTRKTKKVTVVENNGQSFKGLLMEMMSDDVDKWMQFSATRVKKTDRKGRPDLNSADFKDFTATLISMNLYDREGHSRIPISRIRRWTASVLAALYDECEAINGLNDASRDKAKKA